MSTFLSDPAPTPESQALYDEDMADSGYVANASRLWAHLPTTLGRLADLIGEAAGAGGLSLRQRALLVTACTSTLGDSYCSLAWGKRLADEAGLDVATGVLRRDDAGLDDADRILVDWARRVVRDPNSTDPRHVQRLRDAGFDDAQILGLTLFVALRLAFSTVNDALGAQPDQQLAATAPPPVTAAVTYGRPVDPTPH